MPGRRYRRAPDPEGAPCPPVIAHHSVKDKDQWLASPGREEILALWASPNIRTFVDPQDPTRVAGLMDVADMDVVMGAMQSKRWQMPWSTTGCSARLWSSWSRSRPLGALLLSNFGAGAPVCASSSAKGAGGPRGAAGVPCGV